MSNYILYQVYGAKAVFDECKYSLLRLISIYRANGQGILEVVIYTDKPAEFSMFSDKIPIRLHSISAEQINGWRGEINFVHRVKIEIIKDSLRRFPGKMIYCDTDTYILNPVHDIFNMIGNDTIFFHEDEGSLNEPISILARKWKKFLESNLSHFNGFSPLNINMWNAGVIGLSNDHLPLLDQVLKLTDELYNLFTKHTVEQFAFNYVFQKQGIKILSAQPYIFHYWDLKEFRQLLARFFETNENLEALINKSSEVFPQDIFADKMKFRKSNLAKKALLSVSGNKWNIDNYKM